jgi:preprotein translocase subunit YajC
MFLEAAATSAESTGILGQYGSLLIPILLIVVFYFLLIRPQQKQQKKRKEKLSQLKVGDNITTIGRIYGTITKIQDDVITIVVGPSKVELLVDRNGISDVNEFEDAESKL